MASPPTFRLDTLAVHLVTRLEATRRAHLDAPDDARPAFARVVEESAAALAAECRDVLGDEAQARLLEREAVDTFLPRYTRMALAQNKLEAQGHGFLLGDGPVARVVATAMALAAAAFFGRFLPGIAGQLVFVLAAFTPVLPEIRLWWTNRRWTAQLQELTEDLARVQDTAEALSRGEPVAELAPRATPPAIETRTAPLAADTLASGTLAADTRATEARPAPATEATEPPPADPVRARPREEAR